LTAPPPTRPHGVLRSPVRRDQGRAFPQVRWAAAAESGTGALIPGHVRALHPRRADRGTEPAGRISTRVLILADRNVMSHTPATKFLASGAHILWRVSASFALHGSPSYSRSSDSYFFVPDCPHRTSPWP